MISAVGIRNLVENRVNFKNTRNTIITAIILVCALGFNEIGGIKFHLSSVTITLSGLAIASIVGIIANWLLPGKDYVFDKDEDQEELFETYQGATSRRLSEEDMKEYEKRIRERELKRKDNK